MGGEVIALVLVAFVVARVLKQVGEGRGQGQSTPTAPRDPGAPPETMAELWQEMRQQLDTARRQQAGQLPVPAKPATGAPRASGPKHFPAPTARFPVPVPEERGGSIEVASRKVTIRTADQDDGAEALVQRRIDAAAARNGEWTPGDHARFDAKIRAEPPKAAPARTRRPLQQAMIWREVLSPPLALRDREDG